MLGVHSKNKIVVTYVREDYASKAKGKFFDLMRTMWSLGNLDTTVFFQFFDAQVKSMLWYAFEIWGMTRLSKIEKVHHFCLQEIFKCKWEDTQSHGVRRNRKISSIY